MTAEERLLSVLWSQQEFYNTDDGLSYTLDNYHYLNGSYSEDPLTIIKYCFLDIDGNGQQELIAELTDSADSRICVLRAATDRIYAYNFPSDGLKNLKNDGTFFFAKPKIAAMPGSPSLTMPAKNIFSVILYPLMIRYLSAISLTISLLIKRTI